MLDRVRRRTMTVSPEEAGWRLVRAAAVAAASLVVATLLAGALETGLGLADASVVYIPAVVVTALVAGTTGAVAAALAAIVSYDYLFTQPLHTLEIQDPQEWISLALLLFVAIVVGELAALQRTRTALARSRELAARALFRVSQALGARSSLEAAMVEISTLLAGEGGLERVWIALGPDDASERRVADSTGMTPGSVPLPGFHWALLRTPGDQPAQWTRVHRPGRAPRSAEPVETFRVRIVASHETFGSIWAQRRRSRNLPDQTTTRLLSSAADQLGQALSQARLQAEAKAAALARESDALKSTLLQSVSHDFRTPLSTIRAAAGTLRAAAVPDATRGATLDTIEREVGYLDRLVANLLDLGRIDAGVLHADRDVFELDDLVARAVARYEERLKGRPLTVEVGSDPVVVDGAFLDSILSNLIENAIRHTAPGTAIRAVSRRLDGVVQLTVEDAGGGVPDPTLPRLFGRFYRLGRVDRAGREGSGLGLAVVRGLCEAMGGRVTARRSELGGLAIDLELPAAELPADLSDGPSAEPPADLSDGPGADLPGTEASVAQRESAAARP
jgi:two-component system sensor histidine kinase KdpD